MTKESIPLSLKGIAEDLDRLAGEVGAVAADLESPAESGDDQASVNVTTGAESGDYLAWVEAHMAPHEDGVPPVTKGSAPWWYTAATNACCEKPFTGTVANMFTALYLTAWRTIAELAPDRHITLDFKRVANTLAAYLTIFDELRIEKPAYGIGSLMFCVGLEIEAAVQRFRQSENVPVYGTDTVGRSLAPIMELASLFKDTAQACGVPVYPPADPAHGDGSGWSIPTTTEGAP